MAKSQYEIRKGRQEEALAKGRTPNWKSLSSNQKQIIIQSIIKAIAEWRPVERRLLDPLPQSLLNQFLQAIQEIKAQGMAGPQFRATDRLKLLKQRLGRRGLISTDKEPTPDQVLNQQPKATQSLVKAQESLLVKRSEHQAEQAMVRLLARGQ